MPCKKTESCYFSDTVTQFVGLLLRTVEISDECRDNSAVNWIIFFYFSLFIMLSLALWLPLMQSILIRSIKVTNATITDLEYIDEIAEYTWSNVKGIFAWGSIPEKELYWKSLKLTKKAGRNK